MIERIGRQRRPAAGRQTVGVAVTCACLSALVSCSTVPDFDRVGGQAAGSNPQIVGAHGPLTARQSKALLERLSTEPGDSGMLKRHLAIEQAVADGPLVAGNRVDILRDGPAAFHAIFAAIEGARDHVNLEFFTLEDVESDGSHLGDLLVAKRRAGIAVNVIYDSYGSIGTPAALFDRLKQAGINVVEFNPINPLDATKSYALNDRDHRKLLVVDGSTAIIGGVNLSATYQRLPMGMSESPKGEASFPWRDTDLQIVGPAVARLQTLFFDHWATQKGPPVIAADYFPTIAPKGPEVVRILGSTPANSIPQYYVTLLSAIRNAEKSISVSAAYFVPTHQEMEDLIDAARRGVDIRLLLPDQSDSARAIAVAHSRYSDLLEAGVKIYETHDLILHTKTVVVDGVWSVIGSSNFDQRSVLFNDEVDAVVLGSATAQAMEGMFADDLAEARQIDLATWDTRPLSQKIREMVSRIWQTLL